MKKTILLLLLLFNINVFSQNYTKSCEMYQRDNGGETFTSIIPFVFYCVENNKIILVEISNYQRYEYTYYVRFIEFSSTGID